MSKPKKKPPTGSTPSGTSSKLPGVFKTRSGKLTTGDRTLDRMVEEGMPLDCDLYLAPVLEPMLPSIFQKDDEEV